MNSSSHGKKKKKKKRDNDSLSLDESKWSVERPKPVTI